MKKLILTKNNYLFHTREELIALGFTSDEINSIVYGEVEKIEKPFKEPLIWYPELNFVELEWKNPSTSTPKSARNVVKSMAQITQKIMGFVLNVG